MADAVPIGDGFEAVLAAAQDGEDRALELLYRDLAPLVLGYLRGRGASDPEDLTSETFVAVVRNLGRFTGDETKLRSWVLTIAHRRLVDERRRAGRRPERLLEPAGMTDAAGAGTGDAAAAALDRLGDQRVLELLDELTDDQRSVVVLRVVADLPVKEVARILRKRPGAVKTLQRRALARLARVVQNPHETGEPGVAPAEPFPGEPDGR